MTVSELIAKLQTIPGDYEVIALGQGGSEGCECPADIDVIDYAKQVMIREEGDGKRMSRADLLKLSMRPA